jgi:Mg/Co/Ni transporter MgtE
MEKKKIYAVAVVDEKGHLAGITDRETVLVQGVELHE